MRKTESVIQFVNFDAVVDAEKSAREKLTLYTHWRNELMDLYGGFETYVEHFYVVKPMLQDDEAQSICRRSQFGLRKSFSTSTRRTVGLAGTLCYTL